MLQIVSPDAGERLESNRWTKLGVLVRFLTVGIGGQPHVRQNVEAPSFKVHAFPRSDVSAVHADDVVVLIFDPYPAQEASLTGLWLRLNVHYEAADVTKHFTAHGRE